MDKNILNKAAKYGIYPHERLEESLIVSWKIEVKANKLIDLINNFLTKNNLKDASFEFNVECCEGDCSFKEMIICAYREKSEAQILEEIEQEKLKTEVKTKQRQDEQYQLYLNLKKVYEK